jgi:hypothetical protein
MWSRRSAPDDKARFDAREGTLPEMTAPLSWDSRTGLRASRRAGQVGPRRLNEASQAHLAQDVQPEGAEAAAL